MRLRADIGIECSCIDYFFTVQQYCCFFIVAGASAELPNIIWFSGSMVLAIFNPNIS
jgi:hypothetical protein